MWRAWSVWHWAMLVAVLIVIGLLGGGFATAIYQKGVGSGEAASWMQAIGSVGAIVGAFLVANHQAKLALTIQAEKERRDTENLLRNVYEIISQGAFYVIQAYEFRHTKQKAQDFPDTPAYREGEVERLSDMRAALMDIPLHTVGNIDAVQTVIAMRRLLTDCMRELRHMEGYGSCGPDNFLEALSDMCDRALTIHEHISQTYDKAATWIPSRPSI